MRVMGTWFLALAFCVLSMCGCISVGPLLPGEMQAIVVQESPRWWETNRVALVDVDGFIGSGGGLLSLMGGTEVADVREKLERAAADGGVRAVVLRVNSPGGEVSASDTIHAQMRRFRQETGKPVVACLMGTAASGGYYVSLAADRIVATPSTITGSVGVIINLTNVEGLYEKLGLRAVVIKSGEKKDIGSPVRPMTEEERKIMDRLAEGSFERFLDAVRNGRPNMTEADIETISDGRLVDAAEALKLHMVDRVGYLEDAIAEAKELAGIRTADVILYRPFRHYNTNIYARSAGGSPSLGESLRGLLGGSGPALLYLWCPGL